MEPELPDSEEELRAEELGEIEDQQKELILREALGKLNFFLHLTAWFSGCAYFLLLGVFVSEAMPYVFIPIGLWTIGLAYHGWRAWHFGTKQERAASKALKKAAREAAAARRENLPPQGEESPGVRGGRAEGEGREAPPAAAEEGVRPDGA